MIPVFKPSYDKQELDAIWGVLQTGWSGLGPKTGEFERAFAQYVGTAHASALNSCTAALHLALNVVNVEGAEVITTPMTFVSTNHAILYNNAVPVFADVQADTLNIDPKDIEKKITPRTKAIVAVHYGGHACELDALQKIAKEHNLALIEDCAHAAGGEYQGKKLGSFGNLGCFSFHAVKNLSCGDGGMLTFQSPDLVAKLNRLRWMGINKDTWNRTDIKKKYSWFYEVQELGYKCHMNDINAVMGLVQLQKLDALNQKRREITQLYNKEFASLSWMQTPVVKSYAKSAHHNYCIQVPAEARDRFMEHLAAQKISTGVHYFPNHLYDFYKPYRVSLPVAETVWKKIVTLPLYPDLTESDLALIVDTVKKFQP